MLWCYCCCFDDVYCLSKRTVSTCAVCGNKSRASVFMGVNGMLLLLLLVFCGMYRLIMLVVIVFVLYEMYMRCFKWFFCCNVDNTCLCNFVRGGLMIVMMLLNLWFVFMSFVLVVFFVLMIVFVFLFVFKFGLLSIDTAVNGFGARLSGLINVL